MEYHNLARGRIREIANTSCFHNVFILLIYYCYYVRHIKLPKVADCIQFLWKSLAKRAVTLTATLVENISSLSSVLIIYL